MKFQKYENQQLIFNIFAENKLYESLLSWIDNNTSRVSVAQNIANRIKNLNLINSYRKLPFEIVPVDKEANDFKLTVFLDHPKKGSWDLVVLDNGKICGIGTHKELLKNSEIYKEICQSQEICSKEGESYESKK